MALSQEIYDNLMLEYAARRDRHSRELLQKREEVYRKIPGFQELDGVIPSYGVGMLEKQLFGDPGEAPSAEASSLELKKRIREVTEKKRTLLVNAGYPENYLSPVYDCPDCRDTGYIDGVKCHCLKKAEIAILYDQSHLKQLIRDNNFSLLSEEFYEGEDLQRFRRAVQICRSFVNNFNSGYENLYLYGTVGTGKSFLSICTAREVLLKGNSVLYFSAAGLFETLSSYVFGNRSREELQRFTEELYNCDLLIIDDLGTELPNAFVSAQLFSCINERHLNRKSTIISTNLSLGELQDRYSDRILSRISSDYTVCRLTGPDIRLRKKVRKMNGTC